MRCKECVKNSELSLIPFVEHKKRMFKAYQREQRLKISLIATNILWLIVFIILLVR